MTNLGQAVRLFAPRAVFISKALDPSIFEQSSQSPVQRTRTQVDATIADVGDILEYGISVARLIGETEEYEENGFGKGLHMISRDMSSNAILSRSPSVVKVLLWRLKLGSGSASG